MRSARVVPWPAPAPHRARTLCPAEQQAALGEKQPSGIDSRLPTSPCTHSWLRWGKRVRSMQGQKSLAAAAIVLLASAALAHGASAPVATPMPTCSNPALQLPEDAWTSIVGDCSSLHRAVETGAQCLTECAAGASPAMGSVGEGVCKDGELTLPPLACRSSEKSRPGRACRVMAFLAVRLR